MKKFGAFMMALVMMLSMSISVFADGEPTNTGSLEGAGMSEGHVDKKATLVVLPTNPADTTFAYTMDAERLINETGGGKYTSASFPTSGDTGVYFNVGKVGGDGADKDNTKYENTSAALTVTNKSSHNIKLTVTAEAIASTDATKDIPLVAESALSTAENAALYLGLIVGTEEPVAITSATAASKEVTIPGVAANFKTAAKEDKSGYEYRVLTLDEYKALEGNSGKTQNDFDATWKSAEFKLEGAVTSGKSVASDTTAPKVKVTWSWVDPSANASPTATASVTNIAAANGEAFTISYNLGSGANAATGVSAVNFGGYGTYNMIDDNTYASINTSAKTITVTATSVTAMAGDRYTGKITVVFNMGEGKDPYSVELNIPKTAG